MHKWVMFSEASEELADHLLRQVESGYLQAVKTASRLILDALAEGNLPSRPCDPSQYSLEFQSFRECQTFPLLDDGTIPVLFWTFFREIADPSHAPLVGGIPPGCEAGSLGGHFNFVRRGLKDEGALIGRAGIIELRRDLIPGGLPKPRGRAKGSFVAPGEHDARILSEVLAMIAVGQDEAEVLSQSARLLSGGSEYKVKRKRLADWVGRAREGGTIK